MLGPGVEVSPLGLRFPGAPADRLSEAELLDVARRLSTWTNSSRWWMGDLLQFAQWTYGAKYAEAMQILPYAEQTLRNLSAIAGNFEISRRRSGLSVEHHACVLGLERSLQDELLDVAEAERLSRASFRALVRMHLLELEREAPAELTVNGVDGSPARKKAQDRSVPDRQAGSRRTTSSAMSRLSTRKATGAAVAAPSYQVTVRATEPERDAWQAAAREEHVSEWLRAVANEAAAVAV